MNICRASCSMPYLCQKVNINNFEYLDGGITDPIPIKRAINKGYKKILLFLLEIICIKRKIVFY